MNDILKAALDYAERGWPSFEVKGKIPLPGTAGFYDATTDRDKLCQVFENPSPGHGIAIRTGIVAGLVVVDVEKPDLTRFQKFAREHGGLPETYTVKSAGGGRHYYFQHPGMGWKVNVNDWPSKGDKLCDVQGDGAYIVAPPSKGYFPMWASQPALAEYPAWLPKGAVSADIVAPTSPPLKTDPYGLTVLTGELEKLGSATVSNRNSQLFKSAASIYEVWLGGHIEGTEDELATRVLESCPPFDLSSFTPTQAKATIRSAFDESKRTPRNPEPRIAVVTAAPISAHKTLDEIRQHFKGDIIPTLSPLVEPLIYEHSITVFCGPSGSGKSHSGIYVGKELFVRDQPVLYLSLEYGIDLDERKLKQFGIWDVEHGFVWTKQRFNFLSSEDRKRVVEVAAEAKAVLAIFDTGHKFFPWANPEKLSPSQWASAIDTAHDEVWRPLADAGTSILLNLHPPAKYQGEQKRAPRDAQKWVDMADVMVYLEHPPRFKGDLRLTFEKHRDRDDLQGKTIYAKIVDLPTSVGDDKDGNPVPGLDIEFENSDLKFKGDPDAPKGTTVSVVRRVSKSEVIGLPKEQETNPPTRFEHTRTGEIWTERKCLACGKRLPRDARPDRHYCSDRCRKRAQRTKG